MYRIYDDLRWLTRHLEEIQRATRFLPDLDTITRQIEQAQRAAMPFSDMSTMACQVEEAQLAAKPLNDLAATVSRQVDDALRAARPLPEFAAIARENEVVRSGMKALTSVQEMDRQIQAAQLSIPMPDFSSLTRQIEACHQWDVVPKLAESMSDSVSQLVESSRAASDVLASWHPWLQTIAAGTFWTHQKLPSWDSLGVLLALDSAPSSGVLAWRTRPVSGRSEQVHLDAWCEAPDESARDSAAGTVEVACRVTCTFCGHRMWSPGGKLHLSSSGELVAEVSVVPLCPACVRSAEGSPEYWDAFYAELVEHLEAERAPELRLIQGSGEGQESPRGRQVLSLVKKSEDEGEDDKN